MSYRKSGYYEVPPGKLLVDWCSSISSSEGWEKDLVACLTPAAIGRPARRVKELTLNDIINIEGAGQFAAKSKKLRALKHVLVRFLHHLGIIETYPKVVGYQETPDLTMSEIVDSMMSSFIRMPSLDDLGGEFFSIETLKANFPTIVREIAYKRNMRAILLARLRLKLGDIAYRVASGQEIDQFEKSFYIRFNEQAEQQGWTDEEIKAATPPALSMAENGNPLVAQTWELYKASVEPGPFLRFGKVVSNQSLENLIYWFGPQIGSLVYKVGHIKKIGEWIKPVTEEVVSLPWTTDDQLAAARNMFAGFRVEKDVGVIVHMPSRVPSAKGAPYQPHWDLPQVKLRADLNEAKTEFSEAYFFSQWRERIVSSGASNATPDTLLTDIALHNKTIGESQLGGLNLADFDLLDFEESKPYLKDQNYFSTEMKEIIYLPDPDRSDVKAVEVDMTIFYQRQGKVMFPPAFREYVLVPTAWLNVPDPEAEEHIAAAQNLNKEAKIQASDLIRISHRFALLSRLLDPKQLPIDKDQLRALCKALAGY